MAESQLASILSRFRGCLVGALVGDCFGEPFEFSGRITLESVKKFVHNLEAEKSKKDTKILHYTDDTEMRLSIEASLLKHKEFNAEDMANRFAKEYFASKIDRNYGGHVTEIFSDWSSKQMEDVFLPANQQFNGEGSYGNGGGMRIAPVALFMYKENSHKLKELSDKVTRLTHTHSLGTLGAYLQALAVHLALNTTESPFPTDKFLQELTESITYQEEEIYGKSSPPPEKKKKKSSPPSSTPPTDSLTLYSQKLKVIKEFLAKHDVEKKEIINILGNDETAFESIPISIYAFLRALSDINGLEGRNPFERTIMYAIYLEGDTDTIATMAGAIAGAYWGEEAIPKIWQRDLEGLTTTQNNANSLYDYVKKD